MLGLGLEAVPWDLTGISVGFDWGSFSTCMTLGKSSHLPELTVCRIDTIVSIPQDLERINRFYIYQITNNRHKKKLGGNTNSKK